MIRFHLVFFRKPFPYLRSRSTPTTIRRFGLSDACLRNCDIPFLLGCDTIAQRTVYAINVCYDCVLNGMSSEHRSSSQSVLVSGMELVYTLVDMSKSIGEHGRTNEQRTLHLRRTIVCDWIASIVSVAVRGRLKQSQPIVAHSNSPSKLR